MHWAGSVAHWIPRGSKRATWSPHLWDYHHIWVFKKEQKYGIFCKDDYVIYRKFKNALLGSKFELLGHIVYLTLYLCIKRHTQSGFNFLSHCSPHSYPYHPLPSPLPHTEHLHSSYVKLFIFRRALQLFSYLLLFRWHACSLLDSLLPHTSFTKFLYPPPSITRWQVFWAFCEHLIPGLKWVHCSPIWTSTLHCIIITCLHVSLTTTPSATSVHSAVVGNPVTIDKVYLVGFGNQGGFWFVTRTQLPLFLLGRRSPHGDASWVHRLPTWTAGQSGHLEFLSQARWDTLSIVLCFSSGWFHNLSSIQAWIIFSASLQSPRFGTHTEKLDQGGRGGGDLSHYNFD